MVGIPACLPERVSGKGEGYVDQPTCAWYVTWTNLSQVHEEGEVDQCQGGEEVYADQRGGAPCSFFARLGGQTRWFHLLAAKEEPGGTIMGRVHCITMYNGNVGQWVKSDIEEQHAIATYE